MAISALAPWFGSNRLLAQHVGEELAGCNWVAVVFAGGMAELPHIKARTILVNDKHRLIINLARVVANDVLRPELIRRLRRTAFHPDELAWAQDICREAKLPVGVDSFVLAQAYFVCCWMGRNGRSGLEDEFNGRPAIRWNADGGDSAVRFHSAIRMLATFGRTLRRCTFDTSDCFELLARCEDNDGHGIYADPPFPGAGRRYRHNAGQTEDEERDWHTALRDALERFEHARVVCRFYDHPLIRELYLEPRWRWRPLVGRKQTNEDAPEVLLINGPALGEPQLF